MEVTVRQLLVVGKEEDMLFEIKEDVATILVHDRVLIEEGSYLELKDGMYSTREVVRILDAIQGQETMVGN